MFVDLHTHILPYADDGADGVAEALALIRQAYESGVHAVVCTPHLHNPLRCRAPGNTEGLLNRYRSLKATVSESGLPVGVYLGSELLCGESLYRHIENGALLPINGGDYMLIEFEFSRSADKMLESVRLLGEEGYTPIIAHPERYDAFRERPYSITRLLDEGCLLQVNKGSVLGEYGHHARSYAMWLLKNSLVSIIASDCHSASGRNADLGAAYEYLLGRLDGEYLKELFVLNPESVLANEELRL